MASKYASWLQKIEKRKMNLINSSLPTVDKSRGFNPNPIYNNHFDSLSLDSCAAYVMIFTNHKQFSWDKTPKQNFGRLFTLK